MYDSFGTDNLDISYETSICYRSYDDYLCDQQKYTHPGLSVVKFPANPFAAAKYSLQSLAYQPIEHFVRESSAPSCECSFHSLQADIDALSVEDFPEGIQLPHGITEPRDTLSRLLAKNQLYRSQHAHKRYSERLYEKSRLFEKENVLIRSVTSVEKQRLIEQYLESE